MCVYVRAGALGACSPSRRPNRFSSYYYFDLSLAEIAEFSGATRQSVHLALKSVKDKLNELESVLKLNCKFKRVENLLENDLKEKVMAILGE